MQETSAARYIRELEGRCLYDSVDFLFKIGIATGAEEVSTRRTATMHRAINLFNMREYYSVYRILTCKESELVEWYFCTCCEPERVFLRNYSVYLLNTIRKIGDYTVYIEGKPVSDTDLVKGIEQCNSPPGKRGILDSSTFNDPYLIFLLVLIRKQNLSIKVLKRILLHMIQRTGYFWEPYKMLAEIISFKEVEEVLKEIPDKRMREIFMLYLSAKKSILIPELKQRIFSKIEEILEEPEELLMKSKAQESPETPPEIDPESIFSTLFVPEEESQNKEIPHEQIQITCNTNQSQMIQTTQEIDSIPVNTICHASQEKESTEETESYPYPICMPGAITSRSQKKNQTKRPGKAAAVHSGIPTNPIHHQHNCIESIPAPKPANSTLSNGIPTNTITSTIVISTKPKTKPAIHFAIDPFRTTYIQGMLATILGHYRKSKVSIRLFEQIIDASASKEWLDQFTNVLFCSKDIEGLSTLLLYVFDRYYNLGVYHYVAGNLLAAKGSHTESIEHFQNILNDSHPGEYDIAYAFIAQEYFYQKDTCSAIKAANLAIKKNYNDYRVWANMAQIYYSIEMYEYALHFLRKAIELSPHTGLVYESLGRCFEKLSKDNEAIRCYKKGIEKDSTESLALLGDIYYKQESQEYIQYYRQYIDILFSDHEIAKTHSVIETLEKYIEVLESTESPSLIDQWKRQLSQYKL
ncbi:anaphase-promoting complex subunit 8 [Nematocida sp. AWRm80]|nr:anaphase-promoting complex subunit 8 [Nematocida sp. AWRm80]